MNNIINSHNKKFKKQKATRTKCAIVQLSSIAHLMVNAFSKPQSRIKNTLVQPVFLSKQDSNSTSIVFSRNLKQHPKFAVSNNIKFSEIDGKFYIKSADQY